MYVSYKISANKANPFPFSSRCFGPKCAACGEGILPHDYVRKARDRVYHLKCFRCSVCNKELSTGEVLYLSPDSDALLCKEDYLKMNQGRSSKSLGFLCVHFYCFSEVLDSVDEFRSPLSFLLLLLPGVKNSRASCSE